MRRLYLSASSMKDFMDCSYRFYLRREHKDSAEITDDIIFGRIVHEAIEKYDDEEHAVAWANDEWEREKSEGNASFVTIVREPPKSFRVQLSNYYNKIVPLLGPRATALVEWKFEYIWAPNVWIIGKMDRIDNDIIYDWKTGNRLPDKYTLRDFQFYLYYLMYGKIFKRAPRAVVYGHLATGQLLPLDINEELVYNASRLVDRVVADITERPAERRFGYHCKSCLYKTKCEELLREETA